MITPYQLLQESGFAQYTAMIRIHYNRENTSLGAEKIAEMVRAIPGATRVSTVSLDKEHGLAIFNVKIISQKPPKEAYQALKQNALTRYRGLITGVEIGVNTIETKGDFIIKEGKQTNLGKYFEQLLDEGLLLEISVEELRKQFVEKGKISSELFDAIVDAADNKSNYVTWLCKKVADGIISPDSLDDWRQRFGFFETYKQRFKTSNLDNLRTAEDIQKWLEDEYKPVEREVFKKQIAGGSRIDEKLHKRLEELFVDTFKSKITGREYYVFKLGRDDFDVEHYLGSSTNWCTRNNRGTYLGYINRRDIPGCDSAYWIFVNKDNPRERWQLLFKAGYFCDRADKNFLNTQRIVPVEMLKYMRDKQKQHVENYHNGDITRNIEWLENKLNSTKNSNNDIQLSEEYLNSISTVSSSYRLVRLPLNNDIKFRILINLDLAKNVAQAESLLDELDREPNALIQNVGSKKASPLFISKYDGKLVQSDNDSEYFENLKNENEYKLLKLYLTETRTQLNPIVIKAWEGEGPSLKDSRFNGRVDVWKIEIPQNFDNSKIVAQLSVLAAGISSRNGNYYASRTSGELRKLSQGLSEAYIIQSGHNLGIILPPNSQNNRKLDSEFLFISNSTNNSDSTEARIPVYLKAIKAQVPLTFSGRTLGESSRLSLAKFVVEHNTLDKLNEFRVETTNARANRFWDFYTNEKLFATLGLWHGNSVIVSTKDHSTFVSINYNGVVSLLKFVEGEGLLKDDSTEIKVYQALGLLGIGFGSRAREESQIKLQALMSALTGFGVRVWGNRGWQRVMDRIGTTAGQGSETRTVDRSVSEYLESHEEDLHPMNIAFSRRNAVNSSQAIRMTWGDARELLARRTPGVVDWAEREAASIEGGRVFDAIFYLADDGNFTRWCGVIRCVNNQNQVIKALVKSHPNTQGQGWRVAIPVERNIITLDDQGNVVATEPARQPRQPRQPRQNQLTGGEEFTAAGNVDLEAVQEFTVETANAPHAYSTDVEHSHELLSDFGFTALSNALEVRPDYRRNVLIYQACPHRNATTQWVAVLYGNNQPTLIAGYPQNSSWVTITANSQRWQRLVRELDNSVGMFQQCHNICQEFHITLPVAIQGWLVFRNR